MHSSIGFLPQQYEIVEQLHANMWSVFFILSALSYLSLVSLLRFRTLNKLQDDYRSYIENPYSLDYKTAHKILKVAMLHEFPWMFFFGTSLALIKTYGIASGTSLLVQTRQLTSDGTVGKRAEDTSVMISEFVIGSVDDERGLRALSKVNWLHKRYGAKIGNDEMIHTLAMFVLEPQRWVERYEWRAMTQLEKVASFVYWREIGNRMGITGIPDTLEMLEDWTEKFEQVHMVYSDNNRKCAETTMNLYLRGVPGPLKGLARAAADSLLEDRVRVALGSPNPSRFVQRVVFFTLRARGWMIRHFFLPRLSDVDALAKVGADGRLQRERFAFEPWYIKDTLWERVFVWIKSGGRLSPGSKWKSGGYNPEELGPVEYEKSSKEPVLKQAEAMRKYAASGGAEVMGCPFTYGSR